MNFTKFFKFMYAHFFLAFQTKHQQTTNPAHNAKEGEKGNDVYNI
jgi:hypothetical protein